MTFLALTKSVSAGNVWELLEHHTILNSSHYGVLGKHSIDSQLLIRCLNLIMGSNTVSKYI